MPDGEDPLTDASLRPWAYNAKQAKDMLDHTKGIKQQRKQREDDKRLTAFMA